MVSSRMERIIPDKRMIAVLVYLTACLQVVGYSFKALKTGSSFSQYLLFNTAIAPSWTSNINHIYVGLMIAALVLAFFRWSPWPFYLMGTLFLIDSIFRTALGHEATSALAIPGECARYLWFLAIGFALRNARTLDIEIGLPSVRLLLRLGLALTFITHGLEALLQHPGFLDLVMQANESLIPHQNSTVLASNLLLFIGLVDLLVGLVVLFRPSRTALVYMAMWGFITAGSRMIFAPYSGFFEALIRAPHFMLPFLIMIIEGQRTLRKPIRKVYSRALRRMGFVHTPWV